MITVHLQAEMNGILLHQLDLFEESNQVTGFEEYSLLSNFKVLFTFWFGLMFPSDRFPFDQVPHQPKFEEMDTKTIVRITTTVFNNCYKIVNLLESEVKIIPSRKLLTILEESILVATGFIMKLYKRNRPIKGIYKTEENQAKHLLKEMVNRIPEVVSKPIKCKKPIQHIIVERHLTAIMISAQEEMFRDNDICELLMGVIGDIDATDSEGNTLLLVVAKILHLDLSELDKAYSPVSSSLQILDFLTRQGAYIYAKNNEGKTVIHYLEDFVMKSDTNEEAQSLLERLKNQIPSLQTLAAMKARDTVSIRHVPKKIEQFLSMH